MNVGGRAKSLNVRRACVLGILNITPDSFSDGGTFDGPLGIEKAVRVADEMLHHGAAGIDIGAESTRPGAVPVPADEQIRRAVGVIDAIRRRLGSECVVSIDTTLSMVASAALDAGADCVNDTSAGRDDELMFGLVARCGAGLILMHRLTLPARDAYSTQYAAAGGAVPVYEPDVMNVVREFVISRASEAERAGVARERIVLDPGLGFGKSVADNIRLIRESASLAAAGYPVMSGLSRKSFVGHVSGVSGDRPPRERVAGSVALSIMHYLNGARVFRVHDVREHVEALRAAEAVACE